MLTAAPFSLPLPGASTWTLALWNAPLPTMMPAKLLKEDSHDLIME